VIAPTADRGFSLFLLIYTLLVGATVDPAELFHAPIKRKPCKGSIVAHLQNEAQGMDFIVLWMDCDREGENINFEVLDCCMHCMRGGGGVTHYDRVYRAYFSAINPSDIIKAYNSLGTYNIVSDIAVKASREAKPIKFTSAHRRSYIPGIHLTSSHSF
jgi:DNA topoisomerase IA